MFRVISNFLLWARTPNSSKFYRGLEGFFMCDFMCDFMCRFGIDLWCILYAPIALQKPI